MQRRPAQDPSDRLKTNYENLSFETIVEDTEVLPGITPIQTLGHTPGCLSMRVGLAHSGTMIFASDAVFMSDSYGPGGIPGSIGQ
jgi:N-acyl homoserine lactone hydrolase